MNDGIYLVYFMTRAFPHEFERAKGIRAVPDPVTAETQGYVQGIGGHPAQFSPAAESFTVIYCVTGQVIFNKPVLLAYRPERLKKSRSLMIGRFRLA